MPAGHGSRWPGQAQVPAPVRRALGCPGLRPPSSVRPRSWLAWPGPRPPEAGLPGASGAGSPAGSPGGENATFVSCARWLVWHWLRGGGRGALGPAHREFLKDAHGCQRQTWQRRVGRTPKRGGGGAGRGGGREEKAAASGHSAATEEDAGSPARPGPAQPSPWPGSRHVRAASGPGCPGSPGSRLPGNRGRFVPTRGPAEQPGPTAGVLPGQGTPAHPSRPRPSKGAHLANAGEAVATSLILALCPISHLHLGEPHRLS